MQRSVYTGEITDISIYNIGAFQKLMKRLPDAEQVTHTNDLTDGRHEECYHVAGVTMRWSVVRGSRGLHASVSLYGDEPNVSAVRTRLLTGIQRVEAAERAAAAAQKYLDELKI